LDRLVNGNGKWNKLMHLDEIISPERALFNVHVTSKKRALELLSGLLTKMQPTLDRNEVFESLCNRERLGSTGLGYGVALPHGRVDKNEQTIGAFLQLAESVDFDSVDNQPVDLLFAMLVPENSTNEHLNMLAELAELFSREEVREKLRKVTDSSELFDLLKTYASH
jgi:PTS system nitrogen regulatory IIA component